MINMDPMKDFVPPRDADCAHEGNGIQVIYYSNEAIARSYQGRCMTDSPDAFCPSCNHPFFYYDIPNGRFRCEACKYFKAFGGVFAPYRLIAKYKYHKNAHTIWPGVPNKKEELAKKVPAKMPNADGWRAPAAANPQEMLQQRLAAVMERMNNQVFANELPEPAVFRYLQYGGPVVNANVPADVPERVFIDEPDNLEEEDDE